MENQTNPELGEKVTVRKGANKSHPAFIDSKGYLMIVCSCPGTSNGSARHGMRIICKGWDKVTCKN
jgi:hypothetical protein